MGAEIKSLVSITPYADSMSLNYLTPLKSRARIFTTPIARYTPMHLLKIFANARDAQHDYYEFMERNHVPRASPASSPLAHFDVNSNDRIVWLGLGSTGHELHRSLDYLRGLTDLVLIHTDRYVSDEQLHYLMPYLGRAAFKSSVAQSKSCGDCGSPAGHAGRPCPMTGSVTLQPARMVPTTTKCLVCGEAGAHGGLQCPKMSPTAHGSEGV